MKLRLSYVLAIACLIAVLTLGEVKSVQAIDGIALDLGTAAGDTDVERYGITIKSDWNAQWFAEGDWYLGGYWELGASYWDGDKGRTGNGSLGDFHVTPVLRLQRKPGMTISPFFEFGLGAHVHTDDSIGNKNFDIAVRIDLSLSAFIECWLRRRQPRDQLSRAEPRLPFLILAVSRIG
jgi:lipid A 3-O-deacylase